MFSAGSVFEQLTHVETPALHTTLWNVLAISTHTHTDRQSYRHTHRQTDTHTHRQRSHTNTHTLRESHTDTSTHPLVQGSQTQQA